MYILEFSDWNDRKTHTPYPIDYCRKILPKKSFIRVLMHCMAYFILQAALAAKRARELVRTKSVLKSSSLPGKLADCASSNPAESGELPTCAGKL